MLVLIPLLLVAQLSLAQQGPFECHDPAMTSWMTNSRGQTPCRVLQDVMRICNPAYLLDWMPSNYMCDNSPGSITAACCCGSPTFALFSACWSCQYNYTMEATSTTFTLFEKECAAIPNPLTDYDPIVKSRIDEIDIPLWARIEPSAGKWDLEGAWRNATPSAPTTVAPIPTSFPSPTQVTDSSSAGLSSGAIIGIIVGSVFGTAVMFILAAIILWRCLGIGRSQRKPEDDIRIGKDMGYLDGEYIYVPRNPEPRFSSQRESLRPLDLNASDVSREPSDYEYDAPRSRLSAHPSYRETWGEPPSPFSPARHASLDGKYRGYHPGATPMRESMDLPHRSSRYDDEYRPSRDLDGYRRSRDEFDGYRPNPPFRASRDQGSSYRPSRDQDPPYRMSRDYNPERDPGRRRPISGHFSQHRPSGSGDFVSRRPISGQYNGPGSRPGSRPVSGHFRQLSDLRTSTERKKEHRMSVRSGLRHGSFDSTRRSGDAGRFIRLEDREGGGRFSREGWGRRSRDIAHKASLSEGDEDRESAEATGSKPRPDYHQHLRQRSQSARVSHDVERVLTPDQEENVRPEEPSTPTPHPATSTSSRSNIGMGNGAPTKPARNPLRVTNAQSDSDRGGSRPRRPITREPSLLARARTLINSRPSSSGRSSTNPPSSPAPGSPAPVPPSAWHQRLPKVLLRSRPGSSQSHANGPRSSTGSDHSDATSAYHTAQGHGSSVTELAQRTPDFGSRTSGLGELGHRTSGQADSSYRQEVDAGVQIVVESSPDTPADPHASHPPAYIEQNSSTTHLLDPSLVDHRLSVLSRDTTLSVGDSTVSVGELQTWEAARRPTGFVGTGRIVTPPIDSARTSRDEGTMADASSTAVSTTELDMDEYDSADGKAMLGALGLSNSSQEASTIQHQ